MQVIEINKEPVELYKILKFEHSEQSQQEIKKIWDSWAGFVLLCPNTTGREPLKLTGDPSTMVSKSI